jgi:hypothetical protein
LYDGSSDRERKRELYMSEIKGYEFIEGQGDTITCDYCSEVFGTWYTDLTHAICRACLIHQIVIGKRERV